MFLCKEADETDFIIEVTFAVLLKVYPGFVHVPFGWEAQGGTNFGKLPNRATGYQICWRIKFARGTKFVGGGSPDKEEDRAPWP